MHDNGHYVMKIPFKCNPPHLPNNYSVAESRLEYLGGPYLGRKLARDPEKFSAYQSEVKALMDKGYAEKVSEPYNIDKSERIWYLPHHGVTKIIKPGKLRVVFDCSSVYNNVSLNREVLQGPDLTNKLIGVLLRFREGKVAVMADIQAMFHQVQVNPEDKDALRFLWWKDGDPQNEIEIYRKTVHLFGGIWSPSCANYALRKTAEDNKDCYSPKVIAAVLDNFYVDDCLKSVATPEEAIQLFQGLCSLLSKGGFTLNKWVSNNRVVLDSIPAEQRAQGMKDLNLQQGALTVERVRGVKWDTETDTFGYRIIDKDRPCTRRGVLSIMSSIYDPLGFVCPYILQAKKLFQDETKRKRGWDSPLEHINFQRWQEDLHKLENFSLPRCVRPSEFGTIQTAQLHLFSDASCVAYGVTSYIRLLDDQGQVHCTLVMAKSRLAPNKALTIPRLELTAAVLATKMDSILRKELKFHIDESFFWTDSEIVLRYINNEDKRFHIYVANRLAQIHNTTSPNQWNYVTSGQNPADAASRGLTADQLLESKCWINGPDFIWTEPSLWPKQPPFHKDLPEDDKEVKKEVKVYCVTEQQKDSTLIRFLESFSSWYKLKKAMAWVLRLPIFLLRKVRKEEPLPKAQLTVAELRLAEEEIVRLIQRETFSEELKDLESNSSGVKSSSTVYKLEPFKNSKGLLCVGGRLSSSTIDQGSKHQVILPKNHSVGNLIIRHYHQISGHTGKEYVLSEIRKRFWIVRARRQVERVLKDCVLCKKLCAKPAGQRMADLPPERVTSGHPPFSHVGVDCFGPFLVKKGRSEVKRYGCILTCLTMRGIHIEKLDSMNTDSFINTLRRFESRRGKPEKIRSDNGTNFTSAEKELNQCIREWNQSAISEHLRQREIQWEFNPPCASHMGGSWERQIRTVRKVLNALLLKDHRMNDETLSTLFCEVESIVNNRPITVVSDDSKDLEPLTPNHLLLLRSGSGVTLGNFTVQDIYRKQWKQVQFLFCKFVLEQMDTRVSSKYSIPSKMVCVEKEFPGR